MPMGHPSGAIELAAGVHAGVWTERHQRADGIEARKLNEITVAASYPVLASQLKNRQPQVLH